MNQVTLGNNSYVSFALGGVVETVGYLFAYFTIDHMGRKTILVFCQIVAGIACITGGVLNENGSNLVLTLSLIGIIQLNLPYNFLNLKVKFSLNTFIMCKFRLQFNFKANLELLHHSQFAIFTWLNYSQLKSEVRQLD